MSKAPAETSHRNPQLIVRLAGVVLFVQLIAALFESVSSDVRDREIAVEQAHIGGLLATSSGALEVRIRFKLQVQEWKNILLRGSDPADFARYREAMLEHANAVDAALLSLGDALTAMHEDVGDVPALRERHVVLGARYTTALGERQVLDVALAQQADRAVRGMDRPLDAEFDALAAELGKRAHGEQVAAMDAAARGMQRARWIRGTLLACSSLLVLLLLFTALRRG